MIDFASVVHRRTAQADFGNFAVSGRDLANQERPGWLAQQALTFGVALVKVRSNRVADLVEGHQGMRRRVRLRDLETVVAVVQAGGMGKASHELHVSEPAVSKACASSNARSDTSCSNAAGAA